MTAVKHISIRAAVSPPGIAARRTWEHFVCIEGQKESQNEELFPGLFLQNWQNQKANHHPVWKCSENRSQIIFSHQWRSIYFKSAHLFWHECPTLFKLGSVEHAGAPGLWVFLLSNFIAVLMCEDPGGPVPFPHSAELAIFQGSAEVLKHPPNFWPSQSCSKKGTKVFNIHL